MADEPNDLQSLIEKAWQLYGATCLWNLRKPTAEDNLSAVVNSLRRYGSAEAWKLAAEIDKRSSGVEYGRR